MSYDPGALNAALAAAVGEDAVLIADLRVAFLESAERHLDLMSRARCDANWELAAWRLKSLMALADEAVEAAPGDPRALQRLCSTIALLQQG